MLKPLLITRDTEFTIVDIWKPESGVRKTEGCTIYQSPSNPGCAIDSVYLNECKKKYGAIPRAGEAWLVEEKKNHILWTRYDHLYEYGEIIRF